jgi:hypothetical protein
MDIERFSRVVWRNRRIVFVGAVAAVILAAISVVRVDPLNGDPLFQFRQGQLWSSSLTFQLTQRGFPEGRGAIEAGSNQRTPRSSAPVFADTGRLVELAHLYTRLVNSDRVRTEMRQSGPILGGISVMQESSDVRAQQSQEPLPLVTLRSANFSRSRSIARVRRQFQAFSDLFTADQVRSRIPISERIELRTVVGPTKPQVIEPRSKALPLLIFFATMISILAFVLIRENVTQGSRQMIAEDASARDRPHAPTLVGDPAGTVATEVGNATSAPTRRPWAVNEEDAGRTIPPAADSGSGHRHT